jgi:hypothetical protein
MSNSESKPSIKPELSYEFREAFVKSAEMMGYEDAKDMLKELEETLKKNAKRAS